MGDYRTGLARAGMGLTAATWVLLVFGASVRVNDAGLACPDWPLCFGEVIPEIDVGVGFEFGHRVYAGLIGLAFLAWGGAIVAKRKELPRGIVWWVLVAAIALATQIVLGGLTVLELLAEWTVTSHLLTGNTFTALLLLITLQLRGREEGATTTLAMRGLAVVLAVAVPFQLGLGGWVASSHAGLACGTWPTCDGVSYFPSFVGALGLQLSHRIGAYVLGVLAVALLLFSPRTSSRVPLVLAGLIVLQGSVGIANVLLAMPVSVTLLHSFGAAACFLGTAWLNWEVWSAEVVSTTNSSAAAARAK